MKPTPPHNVLKFLRWFCREDYLDEVEGDLVEVYENEYKISPTKAKWHLHWNVLRHFRPAFIKTLIPHQTSTTMLQHNTLLALRNFRKYKSSFLINLVGFSLGLACALFVYLWVSDEIALDNYHAKGNRLYQVLYTFPTATGIRTIEATPGLLSQAWREELPEVESAVSVIPSDWFGDGGVLKYESKAKGIVFQYVDNEYTDIFSLPLIQSSNEKLFKDKYSLSISRSIAEALFKTPANAIGKVIEWDKGRFNGEYTITSVFEDVSPLSTIQFDALFHFDLFMDKYPHNREWQNSDPSTFVVLKEGTDINSFNDKISQYKQLKGVKREGSLSIHRFGDLYLYGNFENGQQTGGRVTYVKLFSIVGLLILIVASINYANLSTALAVKKAKAVGIKKIIGANRRSIASQFLIETILTSTLSLLIALGLVYLLIPEFNQITNKSISIVFTHELVLGIAVIWMGTIVLSGSYPALYLSGQKVLNMIRGSFYRGGRELLTRRVLVVFQFTITCLLMVFVVVVNRQMDYVQNKELGYQKNNIIYFDNIDKLQNGRDNISYYTAFKNELSQIPGVLGSATYHHDMMGEHGGTTGIKWPGKDPSNPIFFSSLEVDPNYLEVLELEFIAGENFKEQPSSYQDKVILNEKAILAMGLSNPIGEIIEVWGKPKIIVGVVKDFHYESLYKDVRPLFFLPNPFYDNTLVKLKSENIRMTISEVEKVYKKFNPDAPFEFDFWDNKYNSLYEAEQRVASLSKIFTVLTITISCLGLLALVSFSSEQRRKEIGIRKILGSSVLRIVTLLSVDFTKMVLTAIFLALPIGYFVANEWLSSFAYRIDLTWWWFVLSGLLALLIAWLTVGVQTLKAANINPVECIKDE